MPNPKPENSKPYPVGYSKPPLHSRFRPGQSGNPRGRPAKRRGAIISEDVNPLLLAVHNVLRAKIPVKVHGKIQTMTGADGMAAVALQHALFGDPRMMRFLTDLSIKADEALARQEQPTLDPERDRMVFELAASLREAKRLAPAKAGLDASAGNVLEQGDLQEPELRTGPGVDDPTDLVGVRNKGGGSVLSGTDKTNQRNPSASSSHAAPDIGAAQKPPSPATPDATDAYVTPIPDIAMHQCEALTQLRAAAAPASNSSRPQLRRHPSEPLVNVPGPLLAAHGYGTFG